MMFAMVSGSYVRRAGDIMTGNLTIKGNLLLRDPSDNARGGMLKPDQNTDGIIHLRELTDDDYAQLYGEFMPRILSQDAFPVTHTGDTDETALRDILVPGTTMYQNGTVHGRFFIYATGTGGAKTFRIKFNDTLIKSFSVAAGNDYYNCIDLTIQNRNNWAEQRCSAGFIYGDCQGISDVQTTHNTVFDKNINLTVQLANAGDTAKAMGVFVWLSERKPY